MTDRSMLTVMYHAGGGPSMGGAAFLLEGEVSPSLLVDQPLPRSLLDRLLFRTRRQCVTRTSWGQDTQIDIPLPATLRAV